MRRSYYSLDILQFDLQVEAAGENRVNATAGLSALTQCAATWRASPISRRSERRRLRGMTRSSRLWRSGRANGHSVDE
jgi:hypothetical protein